MIARRGRRPSQGGDDRAGDQAESCRAVGRLWGLNIGVAFGATRLHCRLFPNVSPSRPRRRWTSPSAKSPSAPQRQTDPSNAQMNVRLSGRAPYGELIPSRHERPLGGVGKDDVNLRSSRRLGSPADLDVERSLMCSRPRRGRRWDIVDPVKELGPEVLASSAFHDWPPLTLVDSRRLRDMCDR